MFLNFVKYGRLLSVSVNQTLGVRLYQIKATKKLEKIGGITDEHIEKVNKTLCEKNIPIPPADSQIYALSHDALMNRIWLLEEFSFEVTDYSIVRCFPLFNRTKLWTQRRLSRPLDLVLKHLAQFLPFKINTDKRCIYNKTAGDLYSELFDKFVLHYNGPKQCAVNTHARRRHSLRLFNGNLIKLKELFGVQEEHMSIFFPFVFRLESPTALDGVYNVLMKLYGNRQEVMNVAHANPQLISTDPKKMSKILDFLLNHGVLSESIKKCPIIFYLKPNVIAERIEKIKKVPELHERTLCKDEKLLRSIINYERVTSRLKLFIDDNSTILRENLSLFRLLVNNDLFERTDVTYGSDIVNLLSKKLNYPIQTTRNKLRQHPHWRKIRTTQIVNTLEYLMESYSKPEIFDCLCLVLYDRGIVEEHLNIIKGEPHIPHDKQLPICLYRLEKKVHFNGDGVFLRKDYDMTTEIDT